nr:uncharacterized protein LOC109759367 [Aegilops tauschii subsp. strangulata]
MGRMKPLPTKTASPGHKCRELLARHPPNAAIYSVKSPTAHPSPSPSASISICNLILDAMSASSSTSLPVPADWLLPVMSCLFCGDQVVTNVKRSGQQAGERFYKCVRYDARQCRFFEFQLAYCRRMTPHQIATARQAGMHPAGQRFGVQQGNGAPQVVPAAIQGQIQAQALPQVQQPPPAANNLPQILFLLHPPAGNEAKLVHLATFRDLRPAVWNSMSFQYQIPIN